MKFQVQKNFNSIKDSVINAASHARTGLLSLSKDIECQTPTCMLYTIAGCVPSVTNDLLNVIPHKPKILEFTLPTLLKNLNTVKAQNCSLNEFLNVKDFSTFLSTHDTGAICRSGLEEGKKIAVWNKAGKTLVSSELYNEMATAYKVDFLECAYDGYTPSDCSKKRIQKSFDRTKWFIDCLFDKENENVSRQEYIMPLVGGLDLKTRSKYIDYIKQKKYEVKGVSFHGFEGNNVEKLENFDFDKFIEVIKQLNNELENVNGDENKTDLLKMFLLVWRPDNVVRAVELGIDVFSGSYPYVITERGEASVFEYKMVKGNSKTNDNNDEDDDTTAPASKRQKVSDTMGQTTIDLNDSKYKNDFTPLSETCDCYTCKHYTKAYINHLINNSEMIWRTLLMIHNLTTYFSFFEEIRNSIKLDNFEDYKNFILKQFSNHK